MAEDGVVDPGQAAAPFVLAVDVGTSSARALVFDRRAYVLDGYVAHRKYQMRVTADGGVEGDAAEVLESTLQCIDEVVDRLGRSGESVVAIAIDTFWHSLLGLDSRGRPCTPIYTWADTRSESELDELRRRVDPTAVHQRTGAPLHSSYWPAKLLWLSRTSPELVRRASHWVSFGEFLYLQLCGEQRVSISMASGTGLFDQRGLTWDQELMELVGVRPEAVWPVSDFADSPAALRSRYRKRWPALAHSPCLLPLGDGACNNVGSGGYRPDHVVVMVGTSGALRVVGLQADIRLPEGLWMYRLDRRRTVTGGALSDGGNSFAWMQKTLDLPAVEQLETQLSHTEPDAHGLTVLPFLAGERSTGWRPETTYVVAGARLHTSAQDVVQATLEAITYRFGAVFDRLEPLLPGKHVMIGSGEGLVHSPTWMQMMSDVFGRPVAASGIPEATSRGAAALALEALHVVDDLDELRWPRVSRNRPRPRAVARYKAARLRQEHLYSRLYGAAGSGLAGPSKEEHQ